METELQKQLNKLKNTQKAAPKLPSGNDYSLLFDFKDAKRIDIDTIFELGYLGLIDLAKSDNKLFNYAPILFSQQAKYFNRNMKSEEELKEIDIHLNLFILELSPYFYSASCHKIIEFLIKIYQVNVFNARSLLFSFLPFYDTKYFIKLLQNINLDAIKLFAFLSQNAKQGVAVMKSQIIKEVASSYDLFSEILTYFSKVMQLKNQTVTKYFSFCSEIINSQIGLGRINENIMHLVISFIKDVLALICTSDKSKKEYLSKGLCEVIVKLVSKYSLTIDYANIIIKQLIGKVLTRLSDSDTVKILVKTLMIILIGNDKLLIDEESCTDLMNSRQFKECITQLAKDYDLSSFLRALLIGKINAKKEQTEVPSTAQDRLETSSNSSYSKLSKMFIKLINKNNVAKIINFIFSSIHEDQSILDQEYIIDSMKFIDEIFPEVFNKCLLEFFNNESTELKEQLKEKILNFNTFTYLDENNSLVDVYMGLNSLNFKVFSKTIDELDNNIESSKMEANYGLALEKYSSSIATRFINFDKEYLLNKILSMKNLKQLLDTQEILRTNIKEFYIQMRMKRLNYSDKFDKVVLQTVLTHCVDSSDTNETLESNIKILLLFLFNSTDDHEIMALLSSSYYQSIITSPTNPIQAVGSYFVKENNKGLELIFKILFEIFNSNGKLCGGLDSSKILEFTRTVLDLITKDFNNNFQTWNGLVEQIFSVIELIKGKKYETNNSQKFVENLSLGVLASIPKNWHEKDESINKTIVLDKFLELITINFPNTNILDHILDTKVLYNEQLFLTYAILKSRGQYKILNYLMSYVTKLLNDDKLTTAVPEKHELEFALINAILDVNNISSTDKWEKDTTDVFLKLVKVLESKSDSYTLLFTKFNSIYLTSNKACSAKELEKPEVTMKTVKTIFTQILSLKNEICLNKDFLKNYFINTMKLDCNYLKAMTTTFVSKFSSSTNFELLTHLFYVYENKSFTKYNDVMEKTFTTIIERVTPLVDNNTHLTLLLERLLTNLINNNQSTNKTRKLTNAQSDNHSLLKSILQKSSAGLVNFRFSNEFIMTLLSSLESGYQYKDSDETFEFFDSVMVLANKYNISADSLVGFKINQTFMLNKYLSAYKNDSSNIQSYDRNIILSCEILAMSNSSTSLDEVEVLMDIISLAEINMTNVITNNNFEEKEEVAGPLERQNIFILGLMNNLIQFVNILKTSEKSSVRIKTIITNFQKFLVNYIDEIFSLIDNELIINYLHTLNVSFYVIVKLVNFLSSADEKKIVLNILEELLKKFNKMEKNRKSSAVEGRDIDIDMKDQELDNMSNKLKEDILIIFVRSVKNFLELVLNKPANETNDKTAVEYIHYFVKFSLEYLSNSPALIDLLKSVLEVVKSAKLNSLALSSFFINLFYYKFISIEEENLETTIFNNPCMNLILNHFEQADILHSFNILANMFDNLIEEGKVTYSSLIFSLIQSKLNARIVILSFMNKIINILEPKLISYVLATSQPNSLVPCSNEIKTSLIQIASGVYTLKSQVLKVMREQKYSDFDRVYLKEIQSFESDFFEMQTCAHNFIKTLIPLLFNDSFDKNIRVYILQKYFDNLITEKTSDISDSRAVSQVMIENLKINKTDEATIQMNLTILTKITSLIDIQLIKSHFDNFILITRSANIVLKSSAFVFITKIYQCHQNVFLDKFNEFMTLFVENFDKNSETLEIMLSCLKVLSNCCSEYFCPFLTEMLSKLIITTELPNYNQIKNDVNEICTNLARKNIFYNSLISIKQNFALIQDRNLSDETYKLLFNFLNTAYTNCDEFIIKEYYLKITKFYLVVLSSENKNLSKETLTKIILGSLSTFILKLKEKQLREIIQKLLKFAFIAEIDSVLKYDTKKCIVVFQMLNTMGETVCHIFVKYFKDYESYMIDIMNATSTLYNSVQRVNPNKKKSRAFFDGKLNADDESSYLTLNTLILENIKLVFKFNDSQLMNDNIRNLFEPLANQLKFIAIAEEDLISYFDLNIKHCIVQVFKEIKSDDLFKEFNDVILNLMRESHYMIKLLALKMIFALYNDMKERYITLISDTLPYVSELLEDLNEKVNKEAIKIVKYIEKATGENLENYI